MHTLSEVFLLCEGFKSTSGVILQYIGQKTKICVIDLNVNGITIHRNCDVL